MQKLFVVSMVKNEEDIIGHNINYLLNQDIDYFVIANNLSTDSTGSILNSFKDKYPNKFTIIEDNEVGYYQSSKMNKLIHQAAQLGATHIIPLDADEVWFTYSGKTLGEEIKNMQTAKTYATVFDMVPKDNSFKLGGNPLTDICYKETAVKALPSVAFKYVDGCSIIQGNHNVIMPGDSSNDIVFIKHYQYRTLDQFKAKLRNGKTAYDATDLPLSLGSHWRDGGSMSDSELESRWNSFITNPNVVYDPAPVI